jgi:hypothetical protein
LLAVVEEAGVEMQKFVENEVFVVFVAVLSNVANYL